MSKKARAVSRGVSLAPRHYEIVAECAEAHGLDPDAFSPAIQIALVEWREQRRLLALIPPAALTYLRRRAAETSSAVVEFSGELDPVV